MKETQDPQCLKCVDAHELYLSFTWHRSLLKLSSVSGRRHMISGHSILSSSDGRQKFALDRFLGYWLMQSFVSWCNSCSAIVRPRSIKVSDAQASDVCPCLHACPPACVTLCICNDFVAEELSRGSFVSLKERSQVK